MPNLYSLLGVDNGVTVQELRAAFKRRALEVHPDKGGSKETFQKVLAAFETLSNSNARTRYDADLAKRAATASSCLQASSRETGFTKDCISGKSFGRTVPDSPTHTSAKRTLPTPTTSEQGRRNSQHGQKDVTLPGSSTTCISGTKVARARATPLPADIPNAPRRVVSPSTPPLSTGGLGEVVAGRQKHIMGNVYTLLQRLPTTKRREVLHSCFSQSQRLGLETWANSWKGLQRRVQETHERRCFVEPHESCAASRTIAPISEGDECSEASFSSSFSHEGDADALLHEVSPVLALLGQSHSMEIDPEDIHAISCDSCKEECLLVDDCLKESTSDIVAEGRGVTTRVRVLKRKDGRPNLYNASVNFDTLRVASRYVEDLPSAIDALVILNEFKQYTLCSEGAFEDRVKIALGKVLDEHSISLKEAGLKFHLEVSLACWLGCKSCPKLLVPTFQNLDSAVSAWRALEPFRWPKGLRIDYALDLWMQKQETEWPAFREVLLEVLVESGQAEPKCRACMSVLEMQAEAYLVRKREEWNRFAMAVEERRQREAATVEQRAKMAMRRVEQWNCQRMAAEERRQRRIAALELHVERLNAKAMAAEERWQRQCIRKEVRLEHHARRAMAREDRCSQMWQRHCSNAEQKLVCRIRCLLAQWTQKQRKAHARFQAQQQRARAKSQAKKQRVRAKPRAHRLRSWANRQTWPQEMNH